MKHACLGTILCLTVHCGLAPEPVTAPGWPQFVAAVRNVAQLTPTYRYQFQNMRDWYFIVENDYDAIVPAFVHSLDLQVSGGLCWHLDRGAAHLNASAAQAQASIAAHSHKLCCAALQQRAQAALCRALPARLRHLPCCLMQGVCLQAAFGFATCCLCQAQV